MIYCYYGALVGLNIGPLFKESGRKFRAGAVMSKKSIGRSAVGIIIDIAE
jgi:hypothetical protein